MNKLTSFLHFHNSKATTLDVILHGGSGGINSPFMQKLFESSKGKGNSVIMFNFPFLERGDDHSSGPELKEELEVLRKMLSIAGFDKFSHIRLIGKSLGGIIASYYLNSLTDEEKKLYEVIVLGYVTGEVKLNEFTGKITIIQGEKDKFGSIEVVKKDMDGAISQSITYHQISNADHSYRNPETKQPIYEDKVIEFLNSL
ncbi:MAG: dienelactone hydrolase [Patescibacteria group bacterium]|nr:MAG: dienelactone hydrolase [Patescibacteria group bacterium]